MSKKIPDIRYVMTTLPRSIGADATVPEALSLMERCGVRHLPVTNGGSLVGVVSDRDIKRTTDPLTNMPTLQAVRKVMTPDPYVVGPDEPLDRVLRTLADRRIGCALVAEAGSLVGIFTTTDAARILEEHLRADEPNGHDFSA